MLLRRVNGQKELPQPNKANNKLHWQHSTEVEFLLLTQQPRVRFPQIFFSGIVGGRWYLLTALLRVVWTDAWKCQLNSSSTGEWHAGATKNGNVTYKTCAFSCASSLPFGRPRWAPRSPPSWSRRPGCGVWKTEASVGPTLLARRSGAHRSAGSGRGIWAWCSSWSALQALGWLLST